MAHALSLARRGLGQVWPNPAVGCVVTDASAQVVGVGRTAKGGRPHAETFALAQAGALAVGGTAYITLEPCAHVGETGPCADALIAARVARVVSAIEDPDPRVKGQGHAKLRAAGLSVGIGLMRDEAEETNRGFFLKITEGRPMVTLKLATSLDGRIALSNGRSQWITGDEARAQAHLLRANHDAILVGVGTILADDPALTCRLAGLEDRSPVRVVLDTQLRTPVTAKVLHGSSGRNCIVICGPGAASERQSAMRAAGVRVDTCPIDMLGQVQIGAALQLLGGLGITRLLVEGGARIATGFIKSELVDRLVWFRSSSALGGDGLSAFGPLAVQDLSRAPTFGRKSHIRLGADIMETFERRVRPFV
jgi:diaminohydroxyphosphoribosylaminopyrimidine deaminase/5-amino-6-(5-phosphoribosylamino)uracil reductase